MRVHASLTCCDLRNNLLDPEEFSQLAAAVLSNTRIETFNEVPIKQMRANTVSELNLSGKDIGVDGAIVSASMRAFVCSRRCHEFQPR